MIEKTAAEVEEEGVLARGQPVSVEVLVIFLLLCGPECSVSTSSSVCTIAPLGTLSSHRTFSLYVHSPANISRCLSLFSSFLFWSSQSTFQEARLRDPKHYIGDEDSDNFFFWLLLARRE